ncbi:MAG: hypothetical protein HOD97_05225 [Candidatus Marinimicrobia bacterium]|jgi:hypothetical protein|nr:hypothetical protein [Candidatus Neomarinimicrobiota bacterium]MBT3618561.1 hypothetical protein [Candidatus Neomarinimicrobiota bacterium]MBT3828788.1 hypothetical protein [Candidatus Neomarinimicrobiota bacterium]MBT3996850.1 hypothetical protein [Candidatus Neomarinimicrobiota bacterium]MBT4280999.1 hypothetical protein [Candidatus Neomarinimicrobiota bacterium]
MPRIFSTIFIILGFCYATDLTDAVIFADKPEFQSDQILILQDGTRYHLDKSNKEVAVELTDGEPRFAGGFGDRFETFIEPVGIVTDGVSIFVCDRTGNKIIQFTRRLEFVQTIPINLPEDMNLFYPSSIAVNKNGHLAIFSEDRNEIWTKHPHASSWTLIVDLNRQTIPIICPDRIAYSDINTITIFSSCSDVEYFFSVFGRFITARLFSAEK